MKVTKLITIDIENKHWADLNIDNFSGMVNSMIQSLRIAKENPSEREKLLSDLHQERKEVQQDWTKLSLRLGLLDVRIKELQEEEQTEEDLQIKDVSDKLSAMKKAGVLGRLGL